MSALERLRERLSEQTPSKEELLRALGQLYPQATPEHKALIRQLVLHLAGFEPPKDWHDLRRILRNPPKLDVDPSLLLPFVEESDWRGTTREAPDWGKFVIAQVLRSHFGLGQKDLPSVFAALGDDAPLKKAVSREVRIDANPSGTGRHPKREHEKADTKFLKSEGDRRPLEREPDPQPEELQWLVPKRYDPLEHVLRHEEVEQLLGAARGKTRQLVEMLLQGFEVHEAAEAIGITPNSASVLLHKFRKKISRNR